MKENITFTDYILNNYSRLMTEHESSVHRHLTTLYKFRDHGPPAPGTAAKTEGLQGPKWRWLSEDPAVVADAQAGWVGAREHIAQRIAERHQDEVYLNYCPACGALTRTPTARLCLSCGHTWFHVPRDVRL